MRAGRRGFARHFEGNQFLFHTVRLLSGKNGSSDKFSFVQRDEKSDARFNRRGVLVQFMAVKWIADFRAQSVTRTEAARLDSERRAGFEDFIPDMPDRLVGADNFK